MIKIILLELVFAFSDPASDKTQYFVHWSYNSPLQLINDISSDLQKLLKNFNDTANVAFSKIPFGLSAPAFPNKLALYSKDLK